jgi:hypothetical protein
MKGFILVGAIPNAFYVISPKYKKETNSERISLMEQ